MDALLVDDHPLIGEIMAPIVAKAFNGAVLHRALALEEGLILVRQHTSIELILLDLLLPGYGGLEALHCFRCEFPSLKIVVLSAVEDSGMMLAALRAGALGYIPKTHTVPRIIAALRVVASEGSYLPGEVASGAFEDARVIPSRPMSASRFATPAFALSHRQMEVLHCLLEGCSNREIANRLGISEGTVKKHMAAVCGALGVTSRTQAMAAAARFGIKHL